MTARAAQRTGPRVMTWLVAAVLAAAAVALAWQRATLVPLDATQPSRLALLVADGVAGDDPRLLVWHDAAAELGFAIETVAASAWLRDPRAWRDAALILPDGLHRRANDLIVAAVVAHVGAGGRLMLVHDAALADLADREVPGPARLSGLAGVPYAQRPVGRGRALPDEQGDDDAAEPLRPTTVWTSAAAAARLQIPPGKLLRDDDRPWTSAQPAPQDGERLHVAAYGYGRLRYPSLPTAEEPAYDGEVLLRGDDGTLLAGTRRVGRGQVLFANLPLGWLKLRTDGFFLHALLRFFAQDVAALPQLLAVPDGLGAQVMNWHVDAKSARPALDRMVAIGILGQGPYSVHVTAGPDRDADGDGGGLGLDQDAGLRAWLAQLAARGDDVGSHGGWTHNLFGRLAGTQPRERTVEMIDRNMRSVESASGQPVREYSAPMGNHPSWVTDWLLARGVRAYYFTGDSGMPPTRSYQDGRRAPAGIWSFPVSNFGSIAAVEESPRDGRDDAQMAAWLRDLADFCAAHRTLRLTYLHPPGVEMHPKPYAAWLERSAELAAAGRLRWLTMAQAAAFLEHRALARWGIEPAAAPGAPARLVAEHARSLERLSWLLPVSRWAEPRAVEGRARVVRDGAYWRVDALGGARLALELRAPAAGAGVTPEPAGPRA